MDAAPLAPDPEPAAVDRLVASARRWCEIYDLALDALGLAWEDGAAERAEALNQICAAVQAQLALRLHRLRGLGLGAVAASLLESTRFGARGIVPASLRLAEAPVGLAAEGVARG
jgi:hypothetical protein